MNLPPEKCRVPSWIAEKKNVSTPDIKINIKNISS
jgi:hypothetical protein